MFTNLFSIRRALCVPLLGLLVLATACETDFVNPNAPTDAQVLGSRQGLFGLSVGIKANYSTTGLRQLIETPAITTREGGITTTFQNMVELEDGASEVTNDNSNVGGLWSVMLRIINSSNDLIEAANALDELTPETRNTMVAYANTMKGMAIGALAQHFEQVVVEPNIDNEASFVPRQEALEAAIDALETANSTLPADGPTAEFQQVVLQGMDLPNTIDAMLARFNLYAGNYDAAISAANAVDLSVASVFEYDIMNTNPIWGRVIQNNTPNFQPRDNFGLLESEFTVADDDGRAAFYLVPDTTININGLPLEMIGGFFTDPTASIPVYLPDEMRLIIAEAELRGNSDTEAALTQINEVRTDDDDVFGVNAGLDEYDGDTSVEALLEEVYFQRRLELFLTGQSLEDSRRFDRPEPSGVPRNYDEERNRNFYPYPERERNNNPNTPADPVI